MDIFIDCKMPVVVAGKSGEHDFRQLIITLPMELCNASFDHYILAFECNGNYETSGCLTATNGKIEYFLPSSVTLLGKYINMDILAYSMNGTTIEKLGKSDKITLKIQDSINADNALVIDGKPQGVVAAAVETLEKFGESTSGKLTYKGKAIGSITAVGKRSMLPTAAEEGDVAIVKNDEVVGTLVHPTFNPNSVKQSYVEYLRVVQEPPICLLTKEQVAMSVEGMLDFRSYPYEGGEESVQVSTGYKYYGDAITFLIYAGRRHSSGSYYYTMYIYAWADADIDVNENGGKLLHVSKGWNKTEEINDDFVWTYSTLTPCKYIDIPHQFYNNDVDDRYPNSDSMSAVFETYSNDVITHKKGVYIYHDLEWRLFDPLNGKEPPTVYYCTLQSNRNSATILARDNSVYNFIGGSGLSRFYIKHIVDDNATFSVFFTTMAHVSEIMLPSEIRWQNNTAPIFPPNAKCEIHVSHGIAIGTGTKVTP